MAVIPEMIFSPEALQAIRETVLNVLRSEEGLKVIEEIKAKRDRKGRRVL